MSYPTLIGEMAKQNVTIEELSKYLNLHRNTISYKLRTGAFSIEEADKIQKGYCPGIPLRELFART